MKMTSRFAALFGVAAFAFSGAAQAAILADYRFLSGAATSEPLLTQSSAGPVGISGGVALLSAAGTGNPAGGVSFAVDKTDGTTEAGAITAGDYITFTVTPNVGNSLDLSDLKFEWVIQRDTVGANTDPNPWTANVFLKSSIGGFLATDPTLGTVSRSTSNFAIGTGANQNPWQGVTFDLSSLANSSTAVTFRIYFYDNGSYLGSRIRLDNVVVNGTVVPEPVCAAGLGLAGLFLQRRRRQ